MSDPPAARRLYPEPAVVAPEQIYSGLELPEGGPARPFVAINMVSTVDGVTAIGGRAAGIGSRLDRTLMRRIRAAADAVLVGSATLRAEPVDPRVPDDLAAARRERGLAAQPLAVTISRDLALDPEHRFFRAGPEGVLIITTASAPPHRAASLRSRATLVVAGRDALDVPRALAMLRTDYGIGRAVVEGGPTLNRALLERGFVDELFWTAAPKLAGGPGIGLFAGQRPASGIAASLTLLSLFESGGELFARYRVSTA